MWKVAGLAAAFILTFLAIRILMPILPKDQGRAYAHNGKLSAGKPRGAGLIFVLVFSLTGIIFGGISREWVSYILLLVGEMLTGYFDDEAKVPWGEWKKGILDLIIAVLVGITFLANNTRQIFLWFGQLSVTIPYPLYLLLIIALVWVSINVTNCADGVDGLSGTLTIASLGGFYGIATHFGRADLFSYGILLFIMCLLAYLWFNATPSRVLMGDAGSRAMGLFLAIAALKSGAPVLYLLVALILLLDGGLGLVKVLCIRLFKWHLFKNVQMPFHDHVRKKWGWSNAQVVHRFSLIQVALILLVLYALS